MPGSCGTVLTFVAGSRAHGFSPNNSLSLDHRLEVWAPNLGPFKDLWSIYPTGIQISVYGMNIYIYKYTWPKAIDSRHGPLISARTCFFLFLVGVWSMGPCLVDGIKGYIRIQVPV